MLSTFDSFWDLDEFLLKMFENISEEGMLNYYLHRYVMSDVSYPEYRNKVLENRNIQITVVDEDEVLEFASQFIEERGEV